MGHLEAMMIGLSADCASGWLAVTCFSLDSGRPSALETLRQRCKKVAIN